MENVLGHRKQQGRPMQYTQWGKKVFSAGALFPKYCPLEQTSIPCRKMRTAQNPDGLTPNGTRFGCNHTFIKLP